MKNLTNSTIDRQSILNNRFALEKIQKYVGLKGVLFENVYVFTTKMVADFYEVDPRTIKRYLENHRKELEKNGYTLSNGKQLKYFKLQFANDINVPSKTTQLGLFNFRAVLNIGMLLTESENAKILRSKILDIVIDVVNDKTGGGTKYINRRDLDYLPTAIRESNYRKEFTEALHNYVDMGNYKYALYTDKIYNTIFNENANEYKKILKIEAKDNLRDTMYSEVLNLVASFETGIAFELKQAFDKTHKKLQPDEVDVIFNNFSEHPQQRPHIEDARIKMASRDLHFRDAFHKKLESYIHAVSSSDFERFLGEQSVNFEKQLEAAKDVFRRLKESE